MRVVSSKICVDRPVPSISAKEEGSSQFIDAGEAAHSQNALAECKGVSKFDKEQRRSREDLQSVVLRAGFRKDYQQEDERI